MFTLPAEPVEESVDLSAHDEPTADEVIAPQSADQSESAPSVAPAEPEYEIPIQTKPSTDSADEQEEAEPTEEQEEPTEEQEELTAQQPGLSDQQVDDVYDEAEPAYEEVQYGKADDEPTEQEEAEPITDDLEPVTPLPEDGKFLDTIIPIMH